MARTLLLFGALIWVKMVGLAQTPPELGRIGIEDGLPQGYIAAMCQDGEGFLWFGTSDGLCRYDGYEFLVFRHDPYDSYSIAHNAVVHLAAAGDFLLVATAAGVDLFDRKTRKFHHALAGNVQLVRSDGKASFYVTKQNHPVRRLVLTPELIGRLRGPDPRPPAFEPVLQESGWRNLLPDADGRYLWLLKYSGLELCRFDLVSRRLACMETPGRDTLFRLQSDGAGGLWLDGSRHLVHFDPARPESPWRKVRTVSPIRRVYHFDPVNQLLWLSFGERICGLKMDLRQLPDVAGPESALACLQIPEGVVSSLSDANGICWFGTNAHGLRFFNPRAAAFSNFLLNQSIRSKPFIDARGRIWLSRIYLPGADQNSNYCVNPDTRVMSPFPFHAALRDVVASYTVADAAGNLWTGGKCLERSEYRLICYHPADGRTETFTFPLEHPDYFVGLALRHTAPGTLWVYLPYEMRCLDIRTGIWKSYDYRQLAKGASMVLAVDQTADGSHWIALPAGIIRAQPDGSGSFRFSRLQNDPATRNSVPVNNIKCVATDPVDASVLWIGTGAGLSRLDTRTGYFTHFTTKNGLPNNVIYGIVPELPVPPEGQVLWLSTNRGLVRFNVNARKFQYFTRSDGLPGDEFNVYAYGAMPDGRLIFGGVEGLTIFNPKQLSANPHPPRVRLTALRVNGQPVDPRNSAAVLANGIEYTGQIELDHRQNNLVIEFAALDYANPLRNQFRFYLEGAEPEWTHQGFHHTAQYLNLSPGAYTFRVKAANSDGVWNDTPVSLRITILPPWYASPWAYALYVILVVASVYAFYRVQLRRRLEQAEAIRLREIDLVKTRLYTNVTHEFRTPLTVILGITEQVRQYLLGQGAQAQGLLLEQVKQNGAQLLQLIHQMLDLSKIEAGRMVVHWHYGDVVTFTRYIVESYHSFAASNGVELHFTADISALHIDYDPEKLQTILVNLLSNAIKFTPPGGRVEVRLLQKEGHTAPAPVLIRVADTGPGIPAEKLPFIFDRFYQADDSPTRQSGGTGIGLALVRELVQLLGGTVSAENGAHGGAVFSVTLPVRHDAAGRAAAPAPAPELPGLPPEAPLPAGLPDDGKPAGRPLALVIEDHADLAAYVMSCIRDQYRVLPARNGQEGIDLALEHIPDLIVSDVMMPLKDGFEVCAQLKNDERCSHIPVVLLTARTGVHDRIAGLQYGADAYLAKPFHPEELRAVLTNLLETRKKLQAKYSNPFRAGAALQESGQGAESPDREGRFLEKIRAVVEENLLQPNLPVEDICRMIGMSYPVVHRKVTALTGRSLTLYVRAVRLQKARVLLTNPSLRIADVAYETGFNDPKFFSRVFLEEYGVTPSAYRRNLIV